MNPEAPLARALRALQRFDQVCKYRDLEIIARMHLIEAETILGTELGLTCTGAPSGWKADGTVGSYDHDGDTCPVHEWLVSSDAERFSWETES